MGAMEKWPVAVLASANDGGRVRAPSRSTDEIFTVFLGGIHTRTGSCAVVPKGIDPHVGRERCPSPEREIVTDETPAGEEQPPRTKDRRP